MHTSTLSKNSFLFLLTELLFFMNMQAEGVVCDNRPSNVSAFKKLIAECGNDEKNLHISIDESNKIYLFYDTVHLIKNIIHNLLGRKRFIFPSFSYSGLHDSIELPGGEIFLKILQDVRKKIKLIVSLKKARRLNLQV